MKQNKDIVVIGSLFFVVAIMLGKVDFWGKIGLGQPQGLYIQGGLFLLLLLIFQNFVFAPFLSIVEQRKEQTTGKREDALIKQEQAEKMLSHYDDAIIQAKIKAVTTKQSIAMQAEEEEKKTLEHARSISDEKAKKERAAIELQAIATQKDLEQNIPEVAQEIFEQVFSHKSAGVS